MNYKKITGQKNFSFPSQKEKIAMVTCLGGRDLLFVSADRTLLPTFACYQETGRAVGAVFLSWKQLTALSEIILLSLLATFRIGTCAFGSTAGNLVADHPLAEEAQSVTMCKDLLLADYALHLFLLLSFLLIYILADYTFNYNL